MIDNSNHSKHKYVLPADFEGIKFRRQTLFIPEKPGSGTKWMGMFPVINGKEKCQYSFPAVAAGSLQSERQCLYEVYLVFTQMYLS